MSIQKKSSSDQPEDRSNQESIPDLGPGASALLPEEMPTLVDAGSTPSQIPAPPPPSLRFGGIRFSDPRQIGAGGMGEVFDVLDTERGVRVALKTILHVSPESLYRFKQEFRSLANLVHPNLITLYELISDGEDWFFTMELVNGTDFLQHVRNEDGLPNYQKLGDALVQLTQALDFLHEASKLHCDIKPSNVLVSAEGGVMVLDFGLVADLGFDAGDDAGGSSRSDLVPSRHLSGTVPYMAPEQAAGAVLDRPCDWYAMGVMLYEALTGQRPFQGEAMEILRDKQICDPTSPRTLTPGIPASLEGLCMGLLQRDPAARPDSRTILDQLNAAIPSSSGDTLPESMSFVGREEPLAKLEAIYEEVQSGATRTVAVSGRSGVGKTTLAEHFTRELKGAVVLSGRCYEQESVPFKAVDSLIDSLARHLGRLPEAKLALLPSDMAVLARVFPVLRGLVADRAPAPDIPDLRELRRRAFQALRELLEQIGAENPLVVYLEDLQWGDLDSVALLKHLIAPPNPPPLLLLMCYRSEYSGKSPCLEALAQALPELDLSLEILPLAPETTFKLVESLLRPATRDRVEKVVRESQGIPYFVHELARHVRRTDSQSGSRVDSEEINLDEIIWNRVQSLPAQAQHLLEVVSVAGHPLALRDASKSAHFDALEERLVKQLRTEHFIRSTGLGLDDEVETFHDRIRESVVTRLPLPRRVAHHLHLAETLDAKGSADPETVAIHYESGERPLRAGTFYAAAADDATEALAFERAVGLYRKSLLISPKKGEERVRLERRLADSLHYSNRSYEAAKTYQQASLEATDDTVLELDRLAAELYCSSGHFDEGIDVFWGLMRRNGLPYRTTPSRALLSIIWLRSVLKLRGLSFRERQTGEIPRKELARIDVLQSASVSFSMVQSFLGGELQSRSTLLALRAGEPLRLAKAFAWEASYSTVKGTRGAAPSQSLLEAAEALARKVDQPEAHGVVSMAKAIVAYHQMRIDDTIRFGIEAEEIFRDQCKGVAWELATTRLFILWGMALTGRYRELKERGLDYHRLAGEQDDLLLASNLGSYVLPLIRLADGEIAAAQEIIDQTRLTWDRATQKYKGFHVQHLTLLMSQCYLHICNQDGAAAWVQVKKAWPAMKRSLILSWESQGISMRHLRASCALEAAWSARRPDKQLNQARADLRRIQRYKVPWAKPLEHHLQAALAAGEGRTQEAIDFLEEAEEGMIAIGRILTAATMRHRRGSLSGGERGADLVREAEHTIQAAGVRSPRNIVAIYAPGFRPGKQMTKNH